MQPATSALSVQRPVPKKRYKPDALMYVTVAFLWVSVWRFQDLWPIIGKIQVPILLEAVLALVLVGSMSGARSLKWTKSRIFAIPFVLLVIMVVGVPTSLWIGKSVTFITKDFAPSLLLMIAVATSLREAEDLNWIAFAHLVGATIYSIYIYLFIPVGSDGRLGGLVYYDANDFALLVVCTIPFAIYFLRPTVAGWKRLFALFSLALFVEMVIKSGSRGGFIAFIALMAYIVVSFRSIPTRLRLSAVGAAAVIMIVFGSTAYWNMMGTILHPSDDYNMKEQSGRKFVWKRGIGYMLTHPVIGVGADTFEQAEGTLSAISRVYAAENRGLKWSTAHNSFVLVGAELGVGGLILFIAMIGTSIAHLIRIRAGPNGDPVVTPEDAAFAQMLIASLIGFSVAGFFVSASYFSFLYALLGLVIAEDSLRRRRLARGPGHPTVIGEIQPSRPAAARASKELPRTHWAPTG
jgi:O-antigen ligase